MKIFWGTYVLNPIFILSIPFNDGNKMQVESNTKSQDVRVC